MKKWLLIAFVVLAGCSSDDEQKIDDSVTQATKVEAEDIEGIWKLSRVEVSAVSKFGVSSDKCFEIETPAQTVFEIEKTDYVFSGGNTVDIYNYCPDQHISYEIWKLKQSDDRYHVEIVGGLTFNVSITDMGPGVALSRSFVRDNKNVTLFYEKEW